MASSSFLCLCLMFAFVVACFARGIPTDQPPVLYGDTHKNPSTSNIEHHQWSGDKVTHPISTHVKFSSFIENSERILTEVDYDGPHTHPNPPPHAQKFRL
ncbi:hypothetical protein JHK84_031872 [Glycine max]|nr:hypothetical protein JHK87_031577 [Glycine soja]KAG4994904.1 hypothetical protein JHK86_031731 [Glycine max]KAG5146329.1 hypothetical protein JHK84_031872 [Glycine max]